MREQHPAHLRVLVLSLVDDRLWRESPSVGQTPVAPRSMSAQRGTCRPPLYQMGTPPNFSICRKEDPPGLSHSLDVLSPDAIVFFARQSANWCLAPRRCYSPIPLGGPSGRPAGQPAAPLGCCLRLWAAQVDPLDPSRTVRSTIASFTWAVRCLYSRSPSTPPWFRKGLAFSKRVSSHE